MNMRDVLLLVPALIALPCLAGERVPLKTTLPKPLPGVTPIPFKVDNLETPRAGPPTLTVPPGCTNLAAGARVTASDDDPLIGEAAQLTDGDKSGDEGSYIEFAAGKQWVQIDLGTNAEVHAILLWHFHQTARVYHDIVIQLSADPDFVHGVSTVFNNDHDNTSGLGAGQDKAYIETFAGKWIPVNGVSGRYVRLYSRGNTSSGLNHYCEVEVWGRSVATAK